MHEVFFILNKFPNKQEKISFILNATCKIVSQSIVRSQTRDGFNIQKMQALNYSDIGYKYYHDLSTFTKYIRNNFGIKNELIRKLDDNHVFKNKIYTIKDEDIKKLFSFIKYSIGNCGEMALLSSMFLNYFLYIFDKNNNTKFFLFFEKYKIHFGFLKNGDHAFIYFIEKKPYGKENIIVIDPFFNTTLSSEDYNKLLVKNIDHKFVKRNSIPTLSFEIRLKNSSMLTMHNYCLRFGIYEMLKKIAEEFKLRKQNNLSLHY
ncbi:hypothetical protein [Silvanigrella aquatica]|uniref:Uncharacterized protein n=1 Tax=Silvanigrella aquatica TaxID=1915309 RepID=A0A1L4D0L4_9BACT|nr:hypothetical protein [Silvanigrella aquatica]APJ03727.1 hypothetical protein AXG55_07330 [Silvanigrella aquatica]